MSKKNNPITALLKRRNTLTSPAIALMGIATAATAAHNDAHSDVHLGPVENKSNGVAICHKGREMQVALPALLGHLVHGDNIGSCGGGDTGGRGI